MCRDQVGFVTYERRKYRRQFRLRKAAENVSNAIIQRKSVGGQLTACVHAGQLILFAYQRMV
jgi:hypothetical protein